MQEIRSLKSKNFHDPLEEQRSHKLAPVTPYTLPHQRDTISSAASNPDSQIVKAADTSTARGSYFRDTLSSYEDDNSILSITTTAPRSYNSTELRLEQLSQKTENLLQSQKSLEEKVSNILEGDTSAEASAITEPTVLPSEIDFDAAQQLVEDNYQEALAAAGDETRALIQQTEVQSDGTKSKLDLHLEELSKKIDEELNKDTVNFDALHAMVLKVVMLHMRRTAKVEHEFISEQGVQIKLKAIEVKDAYTSWSGLAVAVASAGISIGGGGAGLAPFAGSLIHPETAKVLVNASQPLSNASMGINSVGGIFSAKDNSNKGYHEFLLREKQTSKENSQERKRGNGEIIKTVKSLIEEAHRNLHQLFSSFSSHNS